MVVQELEGGSDPASSCGEKWAGPGEMVEERQQDQRWTGRQRKFPRDLGLPKSGGDVKSDHIISGWAINLRLERTSRHHPPASTQTGLTLSPNPTSERAYSGGPPPTHTHKCLCGGSVYCILLEALSVPKPGPSPSPSPSPLDRLSIPGGWQDRFFSVILLRKVSLREASYCS